MRTLLTAVAYALAAVYPLSFAMATALSAGLTARRQQYAYAAACLGWLALIALLRSAGAAASRRPRLLSIIVIAIAARVLLAPAPVSDDVYRYLWEGRVQLAGLSPYLLAPDDARLGHLRDENWTQINHPDHPAIYPPLIESVFALVAGAWPHPSAFKILALIADLATLAVLLRWLRNTARDPRWVLVYALCPAVLSAFAREAHLDALMVLATAWLLERCDRPGADRPGVRDATLAGLALGLAIGAKWIPIVLVPWWLVHTIGGRPRRIGDLAPLASGIAAALAINVIPGLLHLNAGGEILASMRHFADNFHVLDEARRLLGRVFEPDVVRSLAAAGVLATALGVAITRLRADAAVLWTFGAVLVFSPTIHPWYIAWLLPALCARRSWPWLVLVVTMVFGFEGDHLRETTGQWAMPAWVGRWVFQPFFAALLVYAALCLRRRLKENRR